MTKALRIAQGGFGRLALLDMDTPLVSHAHSQCHVIFKASGADSAFYVSEERLPVTDRTAILVNAWEPHYFYSEPEFPRTVYLALYIEPRWLAMLHDPLRLAAHPRFFPRPCVQITPRIRKLAAKGGVIQVNSLSGYLIPTSKDPEYMKEMRALYAEAGNRRELTPEQRRALMDKRKAIDARYGVKTATLDDYMRHILHIIEVAGPEHVGFGADWDGGGGVTGLEDVSLLPKITERLLKAGYSEKQVADMWGGNVLRLLGQVQALADPKALEAL
jgi:hypothetical protein